MRQWPTRLTVTFARKQSSVALDQLRSVDRVRLMRRATAIDVEPALEVLREMFAKA